MPKQLFETIACFDESRVAWITDAVIPLQPILQCLATDIARTDERRSGKATVFPKTGEEIRFEMEAALRGLKDPNLRALRLQQHQQPKGFRIGYIKIIAGQKADARQLASAIVGRQSVVQIGQQQTQTGHFGECDGNVDFVSLPNRCAQIGKKGVIAAGNQLV